MEEPAAVWAEPLDLEPDEISRDVGFVRRRTGGTAWALPAVLDRLRPDPAVTAADLH
ncbi:hypothetical protein AB0L25_36470 [Spirillospora sp. NPDC052242]